MVSTLPLIYIKLDKKDPIIQRWYIGQNLGGHGKDTSETESITLIKLEMYFYIPLVCILISGRLGISGLNSKRLIRSDVLFINYKVPRSRAKEEQPPTHPITQNLKVNL